MVEPCSAWTPLRDPTPLAPCIVVGLEVQARPNLHGSGCCWRPTQKLIPLGPDAGILRAIPLVIPRGVAQGFEVELGRRGLKGSTDRDGVSKRRPGSDRLAAIRALVSRPEAPDSPATERGWHCPASFVGPPTAAKIPTVPCGRAALPQPNKEVPGGYAALRLDLMRKPRAPGAAGRKGVSGELVRREWSVGSSRWGVVSCRSSWVFAMRRTLFSLLHRWDLQIAQVCAILAANHRSGSRRAARRDGRMRNS